MSNRITESNSDLEIELCRLDGDLNVMVYGCPSGLLFVLRGCLNFIIYIIESSKKCYVTVTTLFNQNTIVIFFF